jgi:hypothetical protein
MCARYTRSLKVKAGDEGEEVVADRKKRRWKVEAVKEEGVWVEEEVWFGLVMFGLSVFAVMLWHFCLPVSASSLSLS